eukprot:2748006-Prymnesium_polylepis.1
MGHLSLDFHGFWLESSRRGNGNLDLRAIIPCPAGGGGYALFVTWRTHSWRGAETAELTGVCLRCVRWSVRSDPPDRGGRGPLHFGPGAIAHAHAHAP